ncbi:NAD+ synthase (glutamine-hydrolyzing) [Methylohalomonas lacus]|uniref:Glutamine-dependent NAD(+) synthetase n=1 Tax=Methylohalomonas lacus TaxID=398773 RepID=A0AAE3HKA9_9GAMM|nr:NAD+ synthase [Methylohalomonas lacus]MCS3903876.1 NAD+ synthase (glutamine-hydrolyzing) [Methylohalomonas lacus]
MDSQGLRLVLAQLNLTVGDIRGNTRQIIDAIARARAEHRPDLVIFPELAITSYPPEDLLLRPGLRRRVRKALDEIIAASDDIGIVLGLPEYEQDRLYNSCFIIENREIRARYRKQVLPNYGVFDEKRYFTAGNKPCLLEYKGMNIGFTICEDIWQPGPALQAHEAGADLLININASPYHVDKLSVRQRVLHERIGETGLGMVYLNLVGGQDELIFDGGSMMLDNRGKLLWSAPQFATGLFPLTLQRDGKRITAVEQTATEPPQRLDTIYRALVMGIHDYVHKNGFKGAVIGLSGGIDSALTLALAVDALGADNVEVLCMPSRYTADMSVEDAREMAGLLNVHYHEFPIEKPFNAFLEVLAPIFQENQPADTTEENIQARCRGVMLMAVSNKTGKMVLATGNKSEMSVGYATLYGDMAGGFAPLKDVAKTLVFELSNWRNSQGRVIPQRIIDRPPSAELKPDQRDDQSLPAYEILDPILERYIERDQSPDEIVAAGFNTEVVNKVVRLVDCNEYKRRQAAPGVRISERAFGRDRRYPITSGYNEQPV